MFFQENPVKSGSPQTGSANGFPPTTNGKTVVDDVPKQTTGQVTSGQMTSGSGGNESPDDQEKEERRRAAQKVFGKQGYDFFRIFFFCSGILFKFPIMLKNFAQFLKLKH